MTKFALRIALLLFVCAGARAQSPSARVSGSVRDSSGSVMAGVTLRARHLDNGVVYTARTNSVGRYEFLRLPPGRYEIRAVYEQFQASEPTTLSLDVGQSVQLDLSLEVRGADQSITVSGEPAPLDVVSSHTSHLVDQISLVSLPINGRSLEQLALLAPGMIPVRAKDLRAVNGYTRKLSGNGARGAFFTLDGLDMQHAVFSGATPGGSSGLLLGMDSVEEFEILSDAYPAYVGSSGSVINVITRRGTRDFHGAAFEYHRNDSLDARNFFDSDIPPFSRHQFGGSLGGPLPGESSTFFLSYEGLRERLGRTLINTVPSEAARSGSLPGGSVSVSEAVRPILDRYPLPNGEDFGDGTAEYSYQHEQPTDDHHLNFRTDFGLGERDTLFVRYTLHDSERTAPIEITLEGFDSDLTSQNHYLSVEESHVFSPTFLNTFQFGFNSSDYASFSVARPDVVGVAPLIPGRPNFGRLNIRGLTSYGTETADLSFRSQQFELSEAVQLSRGDHDLRFGFNWKHYRSDGLYDFFFDGLLVYENLGAFLRNSPQRFLGAQPGSDSHREYRQDLFAFYFQDEFKPHPQLTLNWGLRYEWFTVPTEKSDKLSNLRALMDAAPTVGDPLFENPSYTNFAPRLGLAWNIGGRDSTVLRAGSGLFYEPIRENIFGFGVRSQTPFVTVRTIIRPPYPDPSGGRIRGRPRLDPLEFDLDTPYTIQYHLTLQRAMGRNLMLRLGYAGSRGVHLPRVGDINTPAPLSAGPDGRPFFGLAPGPRRNPDYDLLRYTSTDAQSFYNSFRLGLNRRWDRGFQFAFDYTWGRSVDDASGYRRLFTNGIADTPPDYYDRTADRGLSNFHIGHNAVLQYTWDLPWRGESGSLAAALVNDWRTSGILVISSGFPFTANVSFDRANNGVREGQRPDLVPGAGNNPVLGGPDRYFDVSAFRLQEEGYLGNLGRNTLLAPGYASLDVAAARTFAFSENHRLDLRLEIFNLLNRANFSAPQNSLTGGVILFNNAGGVPVGNAARIFSTVGSSRQLQLGVRWSF